MSLRHLIDFGDLTRTEWEEIYGRCQGIMDCPKDYMDAVSYTHLDVYKRQPASTRCH